MLCRSMARIEHDLTYIETWSMGLDLWILAETVRSEFLVFGNGN